MGSDRPAPVGGQCGEVRSGVGQQPGRHRHGDVAGQAVAAQHRVDQRAAGAAVAVGERVDRLELGVRDRGLGQRLAGRPLHERDRSSISSGTWSWCGGTNVGLVRAERVCRRSRPVPRASGRRSPGGRAPQERRVHREDGVGVETVGEVERGRASRRTLPTISVALRLSRLAELGQRDRLRTRRQVLDHRRRRRLRPQQDRRERRDLGAQLRVEPRDLDGRLLGERGNLRRQLERLVARSLVRPPPGTGRSAADERWLTPDRARCAASKAAPPTRVGANQYPRSCRKLTLS